MADHDLPTDVQESLVQLLTEGSEAARTRDVDAARAVVDAVDRLAEDEVKADDLRSRLRHGCAAVDRLAADEPLVAAEYFRAMRALVARDGAEGD